MKTLKTLSILVVLAAILIAGCTPTGGNLIQLDGTSWTLTEIDGNAPVPQSGGRIRFEDGTVSGSSGCNSFSGSYTLEVGGAIAFGPLASTLMACEGDLMDQEAAFFQAMAEINLVTLEGSRLILEDANGLVRLVFATISGE